MSYRSVVGGLALTVLASGLAGCGDQKSNLVTATSVDNGQKIRFIGRILNNQTFDPVGATVEICGITSGRADGSGTFVIDIPGNFTSNTFGDFTTFFTVKITAPKMAPIILAASFDNDETPQDQDTSVVEQDPGLRSTSVIDLGTVFMNTGFSQKIVVTNDGVPLPRARVAVIGEPSFSNLRGPSPFSEGPTCFEDQTDDTDGNGVADFSNLDPFRSYTVIVPSQDLDGVTGFDFETADEEFSVAGSGGVFALDVDDSSFFGGDVRITDDSAREFANFNIDRGVISTVTSSGTILLNSFDGVSANQATTTAFNFSLDNVGDRGVGGVDGKNESYDEYVTGGSGAVTLVFTNPVDIVVASAAGREVSFRYFDNMVDPTTAGFNKVNVVSATASRLSTALGTVWTFTPASTMPLYTPYDIEFFAHNVADPSETDTIRRTYMRVPTGLSSTIDVKADNYNGTTGGNGGDDRVFLDFDRIVRGTYHVIERTVNNAFQTNGASGDVRSIENEERSIVNNVGVATGTTDVGNLGVSTGFRLRVNTRFNSSSTFMGDNRAGSVNTIRVAFVVEDIEGNKLDTILDLPIR